MKREITHSCGHKEQHYVTGYWICDQDRDAARLARRRCTICVAEAKQTAAAKVRAAARERIGAVELRPLTGSPRQVAWAETMRLQQLAALHQAVPDAVSRAASLDDARWWIDHRSDTAAQIVACLAG